MPTEQTTEVTALEEGRQLDWVMVGIATLLAALGVLMILSASSLDADRMYGNSMHYVIRQVVGLCMGTVLAVGAIFLPWRWARVAAIPAFIICLCMQPLVLVPGLAHTAKGAARWISLGPVNLQPSELGKIALVVVLADYLARNEGRLRNFVSDGLPGLLYTGAMCAAILPQKDFGTTVILLGMTMVVYFVAGLPWRYLGAMLAAGVGLLGVLVLAEPYRMHRLLSFLDPEKDASGAGYQVIQGWIALATGGWFGEGYASGLAQQGFLPEPHTDFISAVIGEELGALGFVIAVGLQLALVWRGLHIASRAGDLFGMLVASGLTATLGAQAIINLGVVCGVMPTKGLVLPFLSYGSSAAMAHVFAVGILLRVSLTARVDDEQDAMGYREQPAVAK